MGPELSTLRGDALRIWSDPEVRREALEAIVAAWDERQPDLEERIRRADEAVVAGLRALGVPRGAVQDVHVESVGQGWAGRKYPDCRLILDADVMRVVVHVRRQPDDYFRTWVHDSLHARRGYSPGAANEMRGWQGYEEGMVEGLARLVTRTKAGMHSSALSYDYFVAAYRALATAVGADVEALWRSLWKLRTGDVRAGFTDAVDAARRGSAGQALTPEQRRRLRAVADQLFASTRKDERAAEDAAARLWRLALA